VINFAPEGVQLRESIVSIFRQSKDQTENKVMIELLKRVEANPKISQLTLSENLGIAFGLVNTYIRRGIKKGWLRAKAVSPKRYLYFLTPEGFAEKSRMVKNYLANSMAFFRDARTECEQLLQQCVDNQWQQVALLGGGDFAEIALLVAKSSQLNLQVVERNTALVKFDAVIITDILEPQQTYEYALQQLPEKKIITPELLHISRKQVEYSE
jgi:hypothetical protein